MNAFFACQFSYCPLVWMFHTRTLAHKINRLHESSSFEELLQINNSVSFHKRTLQILATELFKVKNNISPSFMNKIFPTNKPSINTRNTSYFKSRRVKSVLHGAQSLSYLGPKIWELVPKQIRELTDL